jgi:hypothetical protein
VRLDVRALSLSLSLVVIEDSTNDPPHEQWLARLDVGAVSFVFVVVVVSVRRPPRAVAREVGYGRWAWECRPVAVSSLLHS